MDLHRLQSIADRLRAGGDPGDIPVETVARWLSSDDSAAVRAAGSVLAATAETRPRDTAAAADALLRATEYSDAHVRADAVAALSAIAEERPTVVTENATTISARLDDEDPAVRRAAAEAFAVTAERIPDAVASHAEALTRRTRDGDPVVQRHAFTALRSIAELVPDAVEPATAQAIERIQAGDSALRGRALGFLFELTDHRPGAVLSVEPVTDGLNDAVGLHRGSAAGILGNVAREAPTDVFPYRRQLAALLSDPEEVVRQNASYALLVLAQTEPAAVVQAGVGEDLLTLLDTDIVAVQENGIYLLSLAVDYAPDEVPQPTAVQSCLQQLRSDTAVDIDERRFDRLQEALERIGTTGDVGSEGGSTSAIGTDPGTSAATDSATDVAQQRAQSSSGATTNAGGTVDGTTDAETDVFIPQTPDHDAEPTCPSCGSDLSTFDDPTFCPECGNSL